ncbi:hypothetical protein [Nostoc punctiforme]|uniref:Uncharacterized protein n=1 Tax=Nostoc punctiforme (strain ATCC 29133 / PCC 73102) TaxID=63737 RepID=B2IX55_NOSP7|nr:hypothetical protein [Nostoc punctiforme]ACC84590.1 hypothetical protein Npun_R6317 [Nostoc punctiforme PCC 73102]
MDKNNFEAFTNFPALKKNALKVCGQEFIDSLTKKGIYAKDSQFWDEVNKKLNIPDDAYESKQTREQTEREQVLLENKAKKQAKNEKLLANKTEVLSENRKDWKITVFELTESDIFGKSFIAECTKEPDLQEKTSFCNTKGDAYSQACNLVDQFEIKQESLRIFREHYAVIKPLYLMIIYLSSVDQHNEYLNNNREKSKENFTGVNCWNGFDFDIINALVAEGLLEFSSNKNKLIMKKQAMNVAREVLKKINIDGVDKLLEQREYHEEYINYIK